MSKYRLSLDVGTNSIGWCALALDSQEGKTPVSIMDMGVRIFPDGRNPKDGSSNAVTRRMARGMRRNRDRFVARRAKLINALVTHSLLPKEEGARRALTNLDPYLLRAKALEEKLTLYEIGRAVFHLNQRRGFKSNRKQDAKNEEAGPIKEAIREQLTKLKNAGAATFGEYLYRLREKGEPVRARQKTKQATDGKDQKKKPQKYYDFYPERELIKEEFELIWENQKKHHPEELTDAAKGQISNIIFYQRPLKAQIVGKCTFEREEDRAPRALPAVQRIRIYQELNHLQVIEPRTQASRHLRIDERDRIQRLFCEPTGKKSGTASVTFDRIRRELHLDGMVFSHESEKRKALEADTTSALLSHADRFGPRWHELSDEDQEQIITRLLGEADEEELIQWLSDGWGLSRKCAEAVSTAPIPDGYSRLGITATRKILKELVGAVIPYSEAVVRAGYQSHSQFATGQKRERLPYYGEVLERHVIPDPEKGGSPEAPPELRYGKVTNPTVHIALNQMRKVVNEVVKLHGAPAEIHLEVLRDLKNSLQQKKEIEAEQAKNQAENDKCAEQLREDLKIKVNRENIQRLRLWNELQPTQQTCPYTGESITTVNLFTAEVEIDHILPFSRTLDDSAANKVLCKRHANRDKGNRTPFEAWGSTDGWQETLDRAGRLPKNKQWRFAENAMERFMKDRDFIARQLTDSQYITRLAREYLAVLFNPDEQHKVLCLPGRLTGLFRHHLGLDSLIDEIKSPGDAEAAKRAGKNRDDHRNHAVDALIVGLMDRSFLQRAATTHARAEKEGLYDFLDGFGEPWPGFRAMAREGVSKIIVSHKADHGVQDALHNDKPFGFAKRPDARGTAVKRKLSSEINIKNLSSIKGKNLRAEVLAHLLGTTQDEAFQYLEQVDAGTKNLKDFFGGEVDKGKEKELGLRICAYLERRGIRHVRLIENIKLIPIHQRGGGDGRPYKGFKPDGNAYMDVFLSGDGEKWEGEMVTIFDANTSNHDSAENGSRRRVTRLFNRDMLEIEHEGRRRVFYIQKMSDKQIALAEHFEANTDTRTRDKADPFNFVYKGGVEPLRKTKPRFLVVTPAGRIRYLSNLPDDPARG